MKLIPKIALSALMILSPGLVEASPFGNIRIERVIDYGRGGGYDRGYDRVADYRRGGGYDRGDYGRGGGYDRGRHPGYGNRYDDYRPSPHRNRIEVQAQIRLRQLGYYRGPIDGQIGRGSRYAIARFQRDYRMPQTGWLDRRTLRALRLIR